MNNSTKQSYNKWSTNQLNKYSIIQMSTILSTVHYKCRIVTLHWAAHTITTAVSALSVWPYLFATYSHPLEQLCLRRARRGAERLEEHNLSASRKERAARAVVATRPVARRRRRTPLAHCVTARRPGRDNCNQKVIRKSKRLDYTV